jgi:hypothetical protein
MAFSNYPCYNKFKKSCMDCPSCPTGPIGPIGPIGPAGGPTGPTGEPGPTGPSQWVTDTIIGPTGPGYTGIGYTGDVIVRGNLYVEGGIDPTYLAFTPQGSDPLPSGLDGIWIETGGSLRVQKTRLDDFSGATAGYIEINPITNPQITLSDGGLPEINVVTLNNNQILLNDLSPGVGDEYFTQITPQEILVKQNTTILPDPIFTKIMKNSIEVNGGDQNINRTLIQPQLITVNQSNVLYSTLSPSAVSFTDTTSGSLGSSLTAAFLQYNDTSTFIIKDPNSYSTLALFADSSAPGTNAATLSSETLTFNYGSSANFQSGSSFNVDVNNNISLNIQGGSLDIGSIGNSYNGTKIALSDANRLIELGNVNGLQNGTKISVDDSASSINLASTGFTTMGDYNSAGNNTAIVIDDPNGQIDINANAGSVNLVSSNVISLNAQPSGDITIFTAGDIRIGNIAGAGNQNEFAINATKMTTKTTNGFQFTDSTVQYASSYRTTGTTLNTTSTYAQTFNGTTLTATLPIVNGINVGTQYLITNTNADNLIVASSSSQLIYSSSGSASATTRTLATGHSQIFTAIMTTSASNFGWSMV